MSFATIKTPSSSMTTNRQAESLRKSAWYFGPISRQDAEEILAANGENQGTYLVRDAFPKTDPPSYRLSALNWENSKCIFYHFKVERSRFGGFLLNEKTIFTSLPHLLTWYAENPSEMPIRLSCPCPRYRSSSIFNDSHLTNLPKTFYIDRSSLTKSEKLYKSRNRDIEVWKGRLRTRRCEVAVKLQTTSHGTETQQRLVEEARILYLLRNCNIVHVIGIVEPLPTWVITEYQGNGNLLAYYLKVDEVYEDSYCKTIQMARQIASGLSFVASKRYVHRNVRARNVLLDRDFTCKLSGFGYAAQLDQTGQYFSTEGDPHYEPEMCRWMAVEGATEGRFSTASDIWSFAILLFEIFTRGERPYTNILTPYVIENVRRGARLKKKTGIPDGIYDLMTKCWQENDLDRPRFDHVIATLEKIVAPFEAFHESRSKQVLGVAPPIPMRYVR